MNGFRLFAESWRERIETRAYQGRHLSFPELSDVVKRLWEELSAEEKQEWKAKGKDAAQKSRVNKARKVEAEVRARQAATEKERFGQSSKTERSGRFGGEASGRSGAMEAYKRDGVAEASGRFGEKVASGRFGGAEASGRFGEKVASGRFGGAEASGRFGEKVASGRFGGAEASGRFGEMETPGRFGGAAASGRFGGAAASGRFGVVTASGRSAEAAAWGQSEEPSQFGESFGSSGGSKEAGVKMDSGDEEAWNEVVKDFEAAGLPEEGTDLAAAASVYRQLQGIGGGAASSMAKEPEGVGKEKVLKFIGELPVPFLNVKVCRWLLATVTKDEQGQRELALAELDMQSGVLEMWNSLLSDDIASSRAVVKELLGRVEPFEAEKCDVKVGLFAQGIPANPKPFFPGEKDGRRWLVVVGGSDVEEALSKEISALARSAAIDEKYDGLPGRKRFLRLDTMIAAMAAALDKPLPDTTAAVSALQHPSFNATPWDLFQKIYCKDHGGPDSLEKTVSPLSPFCAQAQVWKGAFTVFRALKQAYNLPFEL